MLFALTPGEPAGIGPDLVLCCSEQLNDCVVIADKEMLAMRAAAIGAPLNIAPYQFGDATHALPQHTLRVLHHPVSAEVEAGRLNSSNAQYVLDTLDLAVAGWSEGHFAGLVTGPVQKSIINDAGISFSGHTEYLAAATQAYPVMLLMAENTRVALATTHLPLRDVASHINKELLTKVLTIIQTDLIQRFAIEKPKILVCGLNPHAGEEGHLGSEDIDVIQPVIQTLNRQGYDIEGPLPADTLFVPDHLSRADAVLAMYHDQGLPVLKHIGFGNAVNVTLGLPMIRTSVDHGTALDLAGTGRADHGSLLAALETARALAHNEGKRNLLSAKH